MNGIRFTGMDSEQARALRSGGPDANGQGAERTVSDGEGNPCRHCLQMIEGGEEMLVFALRPFSTVQPYAEVGPAFLHARACEPGDYRAALPPVLEDSPEYLLRGYDGDERIVYGSGKVVARSAIGERAKALFTDPAIRFVHVRSASNNCWQARIERDG